MELNAVVNISIYNTITESKTIRVDVGPITKPYAWDVDPTSFISSCERCGTAELGSENINKIVLT